MSNLFLGEKDEKIKMVKSNTLTLEEGGKNKYLEKRNYQSLFLREVCQVLDEFLTGKRVIAIFLLIEINVSQYLSIVKTKISH